MNRVYHVNNIFFMNVFPMKDITICMSIYQAFKCIEFPLPNRKDFQNNLLQ